MTIEDSCEQSTPESLLRLGIGRMELDWGKVHQFRDHSILFTKEGVKKVPIYSYDYNSEKIIEGEYDGFSSKISSIKIRLDLLGYDLKSIRKMYDDEMLTWQRYSGIENILSFDKFYNVILSLDISKIDTLKPALEFDIGCCDLGEYVKDWVFYDCSIIEHFIDDSSKIKEMDLFVFLENLDPYITLRILADNPENFNKEVFWIPESELDGYLDCKDVNVGCPIDKKILLVTEGKTDTEIISRTLKELFPEISDCFYFIDMQHNDPFKYPFSGCSKLENFCQGLILMNVLNNIIVLFDNDTAGTRSYNNILCKANKMHNLVVIKLPNNDLFSKMQTKRKLEVGPEDIRYEDINGRAVAIECFLDFNKVDQKNLYIRWSSHQKDMDQYQGAFENDIKENLKKEFYKGCLTDGSYDTSKLKLLVEHICSAWTERQH